MNVLDSNYSKHLCAVWSTPHLKRLSGPMLSLCFGMCNGVLVVGIPDAHVLSLHVHAYKGQGRFAHVRTLLLPSENCDDKVTWALNSKGDIVWVSKIRNRLFVISTKGKITLQRLILPKQHRVIKELKCCTNSLAVVVGSVGNGQRYGWPQLPATVFVFSDTGVPLFVAEVQGSGLWLECILRPGRLMVRETFAHGVFTHGHVIRWSQDAGGVLNKVEPARGLPVSTCFGFAGGLSYLKANFRGSYSIVHPDSCPCVVLGRVSGIKSAVRQVTELGLWASHEDDKRMLCMSAMRTCWLSSNA